VSVAPIGERWRQTVYRDPRISNATRVLLLLLADNLRSDGRASVPRSRLASALGVHPSRVTERTREAVTAGLLKVLTPGSPGTTAVYAVTIPDGAHVRTKRPRKEPAEMVHTSAPSNPRDCCTIR
jgi:DNA-binding Lrp family transcriptional regulator